MLLLMSIADHRLFRDDRETLWRRIASHIAAHPEDLSIALENLDRWEAHGRLHPGSLHEWRRRRRIHEAKGSADAMDAFVEFLAEPNQDAEPLKSCSPFVGLPLPPAIPLKEK